jgi:UDP-N-acetylmuramate dehydrogenase
MVDLGRFNSLQLPSCCDLLVEAKTEEAVRSALKQARDDRMPLLVLGGGSNLVLRDPLPGMVLRPVMNTVTMDIQGDDVLVRADAGVVWHDLVLQSVQHGWHGIENLALIPGSVGAAPVQNIGAYGVELKDVFHSLSAMHRERLDVRTFDLSDCRFGYRESVFKQEEMDQWVILSVVLRLSGRFVPQLSYRPLKEAMHDRDLTLDSLTAQRLVELVCEVRRSKLPDPAVLGNVGSFFKNPVVTQKQFDSIRADWPDVVFFPLGDGSVKLAAGWLIDRAGLKGFRLGPVAMHQQQALVLVNLGGATARDVLRLADEVCAVVEELYGVTLEMEPRVYPA